MTSPARSRGYVDYERVAGRYDRGRALPDEVLDHWRRAVQPYLPPPVTRVLDVGAGTGIFAGAWARWGTGATVLAVEPSSAMAGARDRDAPVTYVRAVAEDFPLRDDQVDVAWISTALHHFADADRAVSELGRVIRPGGRVLVRSHLRDRTELTYMDVFPGREKWAARFPDEARLTMLFERGGFELVDMVDVVEGEATFAASAQWVEMMRDADSVLTALTDAEIETGLAALRREPDRLGRLELTLAVFGTPPSREEPHETGPGCG